jgi:hypothetical protein
MMLVSLLNDSSPTTMTLFQVKLSFRFTCDDLAWFTEQLSGLKTFLDEYAPLSLSELPADSPHRAAHTGGRVQVLAVGCYHLLLLCAFILHTLIGSM